MQTHNALKLLKRRTGFTNSGSVRLIESWHNSSLKRLVYFATGARQVAQGRFLRRFPGCLLSVAALGKQA